MSWPRVRVPNLGEVRREVRQQDGRIDARHRFRSQRHVPIDIGDDIERNLDSIVFCSKRHVRFRPSVQMLEQLRRTVGVEC